MSKNKTNHLRHLTICAMMSALSIVLERIITITPASNMMDIRISLSNVPIILAGVLTTSVMGALCGVVSDIVGCFISGYAPFPLLTIAPLIMGLLPKYLLSFSKKNNGQYSFAAICSALTITHALSSFFVTTMGLCVMRGTPFIPMLLTRIPSCSANLVIDILLVYLLLKSPISKNL